MFNNLDNTYQQIIQAFTLSHSFQEQSKSQYTLYIQFTTATLGNANKTLVYNPRGNQVLETQRQPAIA